jgi:hypothetical protein
MRASKIMIHRTVAAFLVFAVMSAFTLSTAETLRFNEAEGSRSEGSFLALTDSIDWLSEDTTSMSRAGNSSHTPRSGALRMLMPAGMQSTVEYVFGTSLQADKNYFPTSKNAILVKLRI